jgi:hypothetical protein
MQFFGAIRAKVGGPPITYDRWCEYVRRRSDLARSAPRTGRNPKTGEPMTIRPRPDGATVVIDGRKIGNVGWSLSGEDEVIVSGDPELIVPWATAVAVELDAEFAELPPE